MTRSPDPAGIAEVGGPTAPASVEEPMRPSRGAEGLRLVLDPPSRRRRELEGPGDPGAPDGPDRTAGPPAPSPLSQSLAALGALTLLLAVTLFATGIGTDEATRSGAVALLVGCLAVGPLLARLGRTSAVPELHGLLWSALGLKMCATYVRLLGGVDSVVYDHIGAELAESFRVLEFDVDTGRSVPGTGSVRYLTGLVHVVTGSNYAATFVVFSFFGFLGIVAFARAFEIAVPSGRVRRYHWILLLYPSLLYWPSSIGKEAPMLLGLGLFALGSARLLAHRPRWWLPLVAGIAATAMIRPHVTLIAVAALAVAVLFRATDGDTRRRTAGWVAVLVLVVGAAVASGATEEALEIDELNPDTAAETLDRTEARTSQGGAEFTAARAQSPVDLPWAVVTVVFRPFPFEAPNATALVSSLEALVLGVALVASIGTFFDNLPGIRRLSYVLLAIVFVLVFCYLFSAIGNFGILVRQRTQMLPFLLVLVALPRRVGRRGRP